MRIRRRARSARGFARGCPGTTAGSTTAWSSCTRGPSTPSSSSSCSASASRRWPMRSGSRRAHYRRHVELFPDGQFVALDGDRVVGATTTLRLPFDFDHIDHTFADIIQGGWLTSHEPDGDWLYGADIGVQPGYRGRGIATALYAARQEAVWRLGLEGQVTGGMSARLRRGEGSDAGRGVLRRRRRRAASRIRPCRCSSASASSRGRCSRTTSTIRSATTTARCSCSTRRRTSRVRRASMAQSLSGWSTEVPGPRGRGDARAPRRRRAGRARQGHRRRRRARRRLADLRRRRQHAHRPRRRHRHAGGRPLAGAGRQGD